MKAIAVIQADLQHAPIGTASRLADELCGTPVLTRTLRRTAQARRLDGIVVLCPAEQVAAVERLAALPQVTVQPRGDAEYPARQTVRTARKWSLDSWRGGMGGTCFFDEHTLPGDNLRLARQFEADAVVGVAAEGPWIDPAMIDGMIDHFEGAGQGLNLLFAQAPPGLAPTLFSPKLLQHIGAQGLTPGWINSYRPDQPRNDLVQHPECYRPPLNVVHSHGRLTCDTQRGFKLLEELSPLLNDEERAEQICTRLGALQRQRPQPFPQEVHIELTTEDQHAETKLRPRGARIGRRGPMDPQLFDAIVQAVAAWDDALVVLGGFGEPLLHPQFSDLLRMAAKRGVFGLAVRTNGIALNEQCIHALLDQGVNVVQVLLDSTAAKHYHSIHGCDAYATVLENIESFHRIRQSRGSQTPFLLPSLVKAKQTFDHQRPFFDSWVQHSGWAIIEGYSHHAGLMPDHRVVDMAPPDRKPCRQLSRRLTILANGDAVACDQDFQGMYVLGNLQEQTVSHVWAGSRMTSLRRQQQCGENSSHPMCPQCAEWHRP